MGAMSGEDDYLPISGLQHLSYCERQCALIHVEEARVDNALTSEGNLLHRRVHDEGFEARGRVVRGLWLRCDRLGLMGKADLVEFLDDEEIPQGRPYPIEYKRGNAKGRLADRIQLCAQAFALEEMLACVVPEGGIYYASSHRREKVVFDAELRAVTEAHVERFRELIDRRELPPSAFGPKCRNCSFLEICQPEIPKGSTENHYLISIIEGLEDEETM